LQEIYQVIFKDNIISNGLNKERSSILIDRKNKKNIPGAKISFR
jgi:hypothetical protein